MFDVTPFAIRRHDLQPADGLTPEDGDGAEVGVALEPNLGRLEFLFLRSGVAVRRSGREF